MMQYTVSTRVSPAEVRQAREKMGLSQTEFSRFIGCSRATVERWENGGKDVTGPAAFAIDLINRQRDAEAEFLAPERKLPMRLWYMYRNSVCTMIDVDEVNQRVEIRNYTQNILFTAFGRNLQPSYADYREFLKSRCFPEERDKMKLHLADLGIPFYDPLLIIQKTEGRMAEDEFWIRIERTQTNG